MKRKMYEKIKSGQWKAKNTKKGNENKKQKIQNPLKLKTVWKA